MEFFDRSIFAHLLHLCANVAQLFIKTAITVMTIGFRTLTMCYFSANRGASDSWLQKYRFRITFVQKEIPPISTITSNKFSKNFPLFSGNYPNHHSQLSQKKPRIPHFPQFAKWSWKTVSIPQTSNRAENYSSSIIYNVLKSPPESSIFPPVIRRPELPTSRCSLFP